ncbi:MAG: TIGR00341 family protein [Methylococcaceae bacterium]|nr:TIGR00341 family protein [Methylococcaceae bacterium]MDP3019042.1 TIGR00341 family protein [Methylococcaceae bacterium]MDP3390258.1 TIGR00341 family protein [Methylococcaceae bacterium]MDZ4156314.1 TIGR00341 family protein [Methylococcales bacterium]
MALRLIEMVLPEQDGVEVLELLKEHKILEHRQIRLSDGEVLVRILLDAEQSEAVLDLLGERFAGKEGNRMVILAVEATLPRDEPEQTAPEEKSPERISREEMYEDIKDAAECSRVYLAMVVLSTIVAVVGLYYDSVAIIIGAMVIAPLLGPNMALSLGTTLGDLSLLRHAIRTALVGIATTMVLSVFIGMLLQVDPASPELASRNGVALGDIVVALASGCAGALAFTTGVSTALIGVMVAVALLPPLVAFGLLLGGGHPVLAMGALSLFLVNLVSVNLAGVTTFLVQGIHPATWWEKDQAEQATHTALKLWVALLVALVILILLFQKS